MKFTKPATSLADQVQRLKARGLIVTDDAAAQRLLENVGYYRLSGYAYPFLSPSTRKAFKPGATFEQVARLYEFDRELRLLVADAIERIEVSVRARIAGATCLAFGAHWFLDATRFHPRFNHVHFIKQVEREVGVRCNSTTGQHILPTTHAETFIAHYYTKYGDPYLPPFWMTAEVLSLGSLSRVYEGIGDSALKLGIANPFQVPAKIFGGWLHSLSHLRNICAHHARLWNRVFSISPKVSTKHVGIMTSPNRFEGHAVVLQDMLDVALTGNDWRVRFKQLLAAFPEIDPAALGFATGWDTKPFWTI